MSTKADIQADTMTDTVTAGYPSRPTDQALPTTPCSVVWSRGHCYVREGLLGRARWVGVDDRGRPESLTDADLRRRGWSLRR